MKHFRLSVGILLAIALCVPALWAVAGQDDVRPTTDAPKTDAADHDADHDHDHGHHAQHDGHGHGHHAHQPGALGRTIQLQFKLINPEEQPTFSVVCAGGEFIIEHEGSGPDHEHALRIAGTLQPVDAKDRVLITFEAMNSHSDLNEGFDGTFSTAGSAVLRLGKELKLGDLGDQTLMLTASPQEQ